MNKQIYKVTGMTELDYKIWCKENKRPSYKRKTKQDFFERVLDGRLVKENGKLVRKNRRRS